MYRSGILAIQCSRERRPRLPDHAGIVQQHRHQCRQSQVEAGPRQTDRRQRLRANQHNLGAAVIGAAAAIVVVTLTGIAVRAPLAKVPENWMKFAVGVMLTSFGTFWGAEGAGVTWPGNDGALLVLVPVVALVSAGYVFWLRGRGTAAAAPAQQSEVVGS